MEHVARTRPRQSTMGLVWEVVCAECGDDGEAVETQSDAVRRLRGPYATFAGALLAAGVHERDTSLVGTTV